MILELEPIFNNIGQKLDFEYQLSLPELSLLKKPVNVKGSVFNRAGVVHFNAVASCEAAAPCDRCAEMTEKHFDVPVEHVLVTVLNNEENDELILLSDMRFETDALIREDIMLALPSSYLCREDCKGVCQYCGKNLNHGSCSCQAPADPRLAVLRQLLDE